MNECDIVISIEPVAKVKSENQADWSKHTMFVGCWWVSTTPDKRLANMVYFNTVQDSITFKRMQNKRPLKKHEELYVYKVVAVVASKDDEPASKKPPLKS